MYISTKMQFKIGIAVQILILAVPSDQDSSTVTLSEGSEIIPATGIEVETDTDATFGVFKNILPGRGKGKGGGKGGGLLKGFLPGGLGFLGGGKEGGKGLFGGFGGNKGSLSSHGGSSSDSGKGGCGGGGGGESSGGYDIKDESMKENDEGTGHHGWGGSSGGGKGKGKGGGGLFGRLRLPFGGRGKGGGSPFNIIGRLGENLPCAAGLSTLPLLEKIPGLPKTRFPSFVPSGVNTCDATCGGKDSHNCTYNWRESLTGFPFLLFKCMCKSKCPPKKILFGGFLNIGCENVAGKQDSRCKCPMGQHSFKCTINILPVLQQTNAYYCACCSDLSTTADVDGNQGPGGYSYPSSTGDGGGGSTTNGYEAPKDAPQGMPLGSEHYFSHLR